MKYDYRFAVKRDIEEYIRENIENYTFDDLEDLAWQLSDDLFSCDSVTGNASGSYTCNAWRAEEYLCHNWDLLKEALDEFGWEPVNVLEEGAEWCDVIIRCYVLMDCLLEVVNDLSALILAAKSE